jgi:hypothetical protein
MIFLSFFILSVLCLPGCAFNKAKGFENGYYHLYSVDWFMLTMSKNTNCFKVHPDVEPGPCVYCSKHDISKRYFTNLCQIILIYLKMPVYNVCRKCYLKFILYFLGQKNVLMNHACLHRRKHAKTILAFCLILMHVTIKLTTRPQLTQPYLTERLTFQLSTSSPLQMKIIKLHCVMFTITSLIII